MINNDFEKAMEFVLKWEGGYSNDPNDPGGITIWGICQKYHPDAVMEMEKLIEKGQKEKAHNIAKEIYRKNYWEKANCEQLPYPYNVIHFDTAVNMGIRRALSFLDACDDWRDYILMRLYAYSKFKQAKLYFRGWANRTLDLYMLIKDGGKEC